MWRGYFFHYSESTPWSYYVKSIQSNFKNLMSPLKQCSRGTCINTNCGLAFYRNGKYVSNTLS